MDARNVQKLKPEAQAREGGREGDAERPFKLAPQASIRLRFPVFQSHRVRLRNINDLDEAGEPALWDCP